MMRRSTDRWGGPPRLTINNIFRSIRRTTMRYGPQNTTNMMGIGGYVGEVRRGPDRQVYSG